MLPLLRKWRSRGHGIHSPFAFSFVTTVLRQHCKYYAYTDIDQLAADNTDRRVARCLFRILVALRPDSAEVNGNPSIACRRAVELAIQSFDNAVSDYIHIYVPPKATPLQTPPLPPDHSAVVIAREPILTHMSEAIFSTITRGMLFSGRNMAVIVALDRLPKQKFTVDI